ncbi:hypothetical protein [Streptomyces sp. MJP52]|uniref:hypothetical protein n=1 Tax=Streptomyces sp. MJP52 TaxID=2940555 RepID=UPI0024746D00|nr:hypothetical protein [Streptomyces sp. MJP52]MDH6228161.1 hypothetical protein [Streptomyces sp. MJP52]
MLDHRLVQTAVIGSASSDHPVILPMDATELEVWRRAHPTYTYWCGYELGGCGGRLIDRLYRDKVCHFAHVASGPTCGRVATGESSADHLFLKQGLRKLLSKHGQSGTVKTHDLGSGPGGAVDLHLPAAHRRLRFQLARLDFRGWREATRELGDDVDRVDWLFGTEGPLTEELLARNGYTMRFRLETVGGERCVQVGSQLHDEQAPRWHPLEECRITRSGLFTPSFEPAYLSGWRPEPIAFPISGPLVFALDPDVPVPSDSPFATEGRRLVHADVRPLGSPIVRTVLSLPGDTPLPSADGVYRATDQIRLLVREGNDGWGVQVDRFVRLNAHEAASTGLTRILAHAIRTPLAPSPRVKQSATTPRPATGKAQPRSAKGNAERKAGSTLTWNQAVVTVRDMLLAAARRGRTLDWSAMRSQLGEPLISMTSKQRTKLLHEVDNPLWDTKPVLSVLLREGGHLLPELPAVLDSLGVRGASGLSVDSPTLAAWLAREKERAFAMYAKPARQAPPRTDLPAARASSALTAKQQREIAASIKNIKEMKFKSGLAGPRASTADEWHQVREATDHLAEKMAAIGDGFSTSATVRRTIARARRWLTFATRGSRLPLNPSKRDRQVLGMSAADVRAQLATAKRDVEAVEVARTQRLSSTDRG